MKNSWQKTATMQLCTTHNLKSWPKKLKLTQKEIGGIFPPIFLLITGKATEYRDSPEIKPGLCYTESGLYDKRITGPRVFKQLW